MQKNDGGSFSVEEVGDRSAEEARSALIARSRPGTRPRSAPTMKREAVPRLVAISQAMGLEAEASPRGRWIRFQSAEGHIYVSAAVFGQGYYTWDDAEHPEAVGPYLDPCEAIRAGLRRVAQRRTGTTCRG